MTDLLYFILILAGLASVYALFKPLKRFIFKYKWNKINDQEFSTQDRALLEKCFHPYSVLNQDEKKRLERKILYFLKYKKFWPLHKFEITPSMKKLIAAQACLLILNIDEDIYPALVNIYIAQYPFVEKDKTFNVHMNNHGQVPRLGESWKDGPIVLAWSSIEQGMANWSDGHNVVFHEFAHQLDALDGGMDGTPPLSSEKALNKWAIFMSRDFLDLRQRVGRHHKTDIDPYGATNEAEFFAVTVEEFFERPHFFKQHHDEIYSLYLDYFKLDPMRWAVPN